MVGGAGHSVPQKKKPKSVTIMADRVVSGMLSNQSPAIGGLFAE
jgi:hypothetical protein